MVSVIIPNYNHAPYLKKRIDSVLNQTYTNTELIILDDCSPDNSREVIETYRMHKKISHIVYNQTNSGNTFYQWHKGIQLAQGEYIWIAESDDWCEANFLETIIGGLQKKEDTVFGYCQSFCVDNSGKIIFQSNYKYLDGYLPKSNFLETNLVFGNTVYNASMAVFKKKYYGFVSPFFRELKFAGDHAFWAELSRMGTVYVSAKPLNYFRKHEQDISGKVYLSGNNFSEEIKLLDHFKSNLGLSKTLYLKAWVKLYNRYVKVKKMLDSSTRKEIETNFFKQKNFIEQYKLMLWSMASRLKALLK